MNDLSRGGQLAPMSADTLGGQRRSLAPLVVVTVAAMVFALLLIMVRVQWAPLESADHGAAAHINSLIAGDTALVGVVKAVTWLGSNGVLWTVIGAAAIILALRKRWRLAAYLLVTGAGALILDPILKSFVGRLRPVVAHPIAHGTGDSFPSGHSLGSIVCYGAILLVFLPAARGRWRPAFITAIVTLVALIGISRILLGVHYLSDVVGAWAVGIAWLGVTATAFELTRRASGQPVTGPITEGLEPEARADLKPARPEAAAGNSPAGHRVRIAAGVLVAWVLILGVIVGVGELVTKDGNGNVLGDRTIPHWFAARRTASWNHWSQIFSTLGATQAILIVALATCVVFLALTRHWRPVIFIATVMIGELGAFLAAAAVVKRPRPDVTHLDQHLPTSAYPSGHEAATCCLYVAIAILVIGHARGWWRWLFLVPAIAMPVLVALSRIYRGEHHPTDILGSLLFSALWLTATSLLIRPNADGRTWRRPTATGADADARAPSFFPGLWHAADGIASGTRPVRGGRGGGGPADHRRAYGAPSQCLAQRVLPRAAIPAAHRQATSLTQPLGHAPQISSRVCGISSGVCGLGKEGNAPDTIDPESQMKIGARHPYLHERRAADWILSGCQVAGVGAAAAISRRRDCGPCGPDDPSAGP